MVEKQGQQYFINKFLFESSVSHMVEKLIKF